MISLDDALRDFEQATEPDPQRLARVRALDRRAPGGRLSLLALGVVATLALGWVALSPKPVAMALSGEGARVALGPHVQAEVFGQGEALGDGRRTRVRWAEGRLALDVAPDQGVDLEVSAAEGVVRVLGTRFEVTRDPLGLGVEVTRGAVELLCVEAGAEGAVTLRAGEVGACLPVDADGWLRRALYLMGDDPQAALDATLRGLALEPEGPLDDALRFQRVAALWSLGRHEEAGELARALRAEGEGPRREELDALIRLLETSDMKKEERR